MPSQTIISIEGDDFLINGEKTYAGRVWDGRRIEGLLLNSRMVQGIFDDLNPETRGQWDYPFGSWDPELNNREFLAAMPTWREHGLLSFTINLQGGSPRGYSQAQPWHNSAFEPDGTLRPDYMERLGRILDRADDLGMAPIVGFFYFGQENRLADERAILAATDNATDWLLERGDRHVLVEINNECNIRYQQPLLMPEGVHELIERVQQRSAGKVETDAGRLLVSASYGGHELPRPNLAKVADFILLHGNGDNDPDRIRKLVDDARQVEGYHGQPIVFNEDDHFDFDQDDCHFIAAVDRHASWGFFDYRFDGEGFEDGYQSVPVDWGIRSPRKRGFFDLLRKMTAVGCCGKCQQPKE